MNKILKRAADHYGVNHQSMMFVEEASELMKELSKFQRGHQNVYSIAEEIADVEIMLEQLKYLFDCEAESEAWRGYKTIRLEERLNDEEQSLLALRSQKSR